MMKREGGKDGREGGRERGYLSVSACPLNF